MSFPVLFNISATGLGASASEQTTVNPEVEVLANPVVPVAQPAHLTVRTNGTDGTLTMTNSGHGIITGQRIDLYWMDGHAYAGTVGTVSGTSVPFTGFSGDALPIATTGVSAAKPVQRTFDIVGDDLVALIAKCPAEYQVVFESSGPADLLEVHMYGTMYTWYGLSTNPLAGDTVATIWVSHADQSTAYNVTVSAGVSA